jgi:hypothetical protein
MYKKDVLAYYGAASKVADELDITKQAVNAWPRVVPRGAAFELHHITEGRLAIDRDLYRRQKRRLMKKKRAARTTRTVESRPSA